MTGRTGRARRSGRVPKFCMIIAQNYLAQARVLADSIARYHDGARLSVLIIDARSSTEHAEERFDLVTPSELDLSESEFRKMAIIYDVTELATALKPWLLRLLLDRGEAPVVYLDPDTEAFTSLAEVGHLAQQHDIVLIPHALKPTPDDGLRPTPNDIAQSGVYNLGFIAVGTGARSLLDWWSTRLSRDCVVAPEEGLFVDQRLMDFVPGYFRHHVHRDPSYNVAYWNLHERSVTRTDSGFEVNGAPLRFFHFSGYDPLRPDQLSKHQEPNPRTRLAESPDLNRLCDEYGERLLDAGYREAAVRPYALGVSAGGLPFDRRVRRLYRRALIAFEGGPSNYSGVTAASMMMRRAVFNDLGGFDESLAVAFNDVDFCLRALRSGYRHVCLGDVVLIHHESRTRGHDETIEKRERFQFEFELMRQRWASVLDADPYYSPHLTRLSEDFGTDPMHTNAETVHADGRPH